MTEKQHAPPDDCDLLISWIEWSQKAMSRVEELTERLLAADIEAKKAEANAKELEAKLAKAVEQMQRVKDYRYDPNIGIELNRLEDTLAELKGDKP